MLLVRGHVQPENFEKMLQFLSSSHALSELSELFNAYRLLFLQHSLLENMEIHIFTIADYDYINLGSPVTSSR